jgi:hypothetical protein
VDAKRGKYEKFSRFIIAQEAGKLFMNIAKENFDVGCKHETRRERCRDEIAFFGSSDVKMFRR